MAVRLPLIISQPPRRDSAATDVTEALVTEAMLASGIDANLIGGLDAIAAGSTDHLCLQGNNRSLALAAWLPLERAVQEWQRLGLDGRLIDVSLHGAPAENTQSQSQSQRSVYYFLLTPTTNVTQLLKRCRELADSQQVQLVQLGGLSNRAQSSGMAVTLPIAQPSSQVASPSTAHPPMNTVDPIPTPAAPDADEEFSDLDQLVADLDALDL